VTLTSLGATQRRCGIATVRLVPSSAQPHLPWLPAAHGHRDGRRKCVPWDYCTRLQPHRDGLFKIQV